MSQPMADPAAGATAGTTADRTAGTDAGAADGAAASSRPRWVRVVAGGLGAVAVALAAGWALAAVLRLLDLGPTPTARLGAWLAGLGLLGPWQQSVDAVTLDPTSWRSAASGAPLLVTAAAAGWVWRWGRARPGGVATATAVAEAAVAGLVAAAGAFVLALVSSHTVAVTNDAGSVTTVEGPAAWWADGGRVGLVPAAGMLVALVWALAALAHGPRWADGWRDVVAVLVVPGLVLDVVALVGLWWLLSGWTLPIAAVLLLPLLGTDLLLAAAGAPFVVAVPRLTAGEVTAGTWSVGLGAVAGGLLLALVVAAVAGFVRARRRDPGVPTATATAVAAAACGLAAFGLAAGTAISATLPLGLGGDAAMRVAPLPAAVAGAVLGAASVLLGTPPARWSRRRRREAGADPVQ